MKIALTQACLKVKCYFCFSIVADNVILATATSETEFRRKLFARPAFSRKSGQFCVAQQRQLLALVAFWQGRDILCMVYTAAEGVVEVYYALNLLKAIGYL